MKKLVLLFFALGVMGMAQTTPPVALMPVVRQQFFDVNGHPLSGGFVATFAAGTSSPLATYTDSSGTSQNINPTPLDSGGFASIWLGPQAYKIVVFDSSMTQQYAVDQVSDVGQLLYAKAVLLNNNGADQTVLGPLSAAYFHGTTIHTTSPGVRVALLDPNTQIDTLNPPTITGVQPANAGQVYKVPDPQSPLSNFVLSPNSDGSNKLDCTQPGISCIRNVHVNIEGASCNNTTAALGWDSFPTNAPVPVCVTGTNIQKGVMAFPAAATLIQQNSGTAAASNTVVIPYPATTTAHDLLVVEIAFDGANTKTISGCSDGTNTPWAQAVHSVNNTLGFDIWYFNGDSAAVSGSLTCTVAAAATTDLAATFQEYSGTVTSNIKDVSQINTGTGTAVTTGNTAGTAGNTELVLAGVASAGANTVASANGWNQHLVATQGSNVTVNSQGMIQQTTSTESSTFTLGSSAVWAAGIVTFKVTPNSFIQAQRSFSLPGSFTTSSPISASFKWQAPLKPTGTVTAQLFSSISCTADGNSDDSVLTVGNQQSAPVPNTSANTITTTNFPISNGLTSGCAAGNLMHLQVGRFRYTAGDTYEGYVYINNVDLQFGVTQ